MGRFIGQQLADKTVKAVFMLADGLQTNGSELLRGLNSVLYDQVAFINHPDPLLIVGGLAADPHQFKRTWVLDNGWPKMGYVAAVGFYGNAIQISCGSQGGWTIFGPERTVTRSEANILYELDHKPVLQLYQEYLGKRARDLPASGLFFPLALVKPSKKSIKTCSHTWFSMGRGWSRPAGLRAECFWGLAGFTSFNILYDLFLHAFPKPIPR